MATLSIRGNPTVKCVDGNARVLSSQDNVGKSENPAQINWQDKNAMKSVMRICDFTRHFLFFPNRNLC